MTSSFYSLLKSLCAVFPETGGQPSSITQSLEDQVIQATHTVSARFCKSLFWALFPELPKLNHFLSLQYAVFLNLRKPLRLYDYELQTGVTKNYRKQEKRLLSLVQRNSVKIHSVAMSEAKQICKYKETRAQ